MREIDVDDSGADRHRIGNTMNYHKAYHRIVDSSHRIHDSANLPGRASILAATLSVT